MFPQTNRVMAVFAATFALVPVLFSGCLISGDTPNHPKSFYTFTVAPEEAGSMNSPVNGKLFVMDFTISPEYSGNSFVYKENNQLITDYYNRFLIPPEKLIKEKCASWMDRASVFNAVFTDTRVLPPEYVLSGKVTKLVCDLSQNRTPRAGIEISFLLIRHDRNDDILLNTTIRAEKELAEFDPDILVSRYNQCLEEIFSTLEQRILTAVKDPV